MNDEQLINVDILFGTIELHNAPPRWEGETAIMRGRTVERDRSGKVIRDETYDVGCRVLNAGLWPQFFDTSLKPPAPRPWWRFW